MGFFLVFEGIEGCGKTTQIKMLGDYCKKKGLPCVVTREPGGTPIGEEIRKIFLHSDNIEITHLTELLLITASRVQHLQQVIQPALDKKHSHVRQILWRYPGLPGLCWRYLPGTYQ